MKIFANTTLWLCPMAVPFIMVVVSRTLTGPTSFFATLIGIPVSDVVFLGIMQPRIRIFSKQNCNCRGIFHGYPVENFTDMTHRISHDMDWDIPWDIPWDIHGISHVDSKSIVFVMYIAKAIQNTK